jgi:hypothetical protein
MKSAAYGRQQKRGPISGSCASLSVVVVSAGSAHVAHDATQALTSATREVPAQVILVSKNNDPTLAKSVERNGGEFVVAPSGSSRAEMCDLGMSKVVGSIVAVRDDYAIGDAAWLETYRSVLSRGRSSVPVVPPKESVVMDTLVAGRVVRADAMDPLDALDPTAEADSPGMAAAV